MFTDLFSGFDYSSLYFFYDMSKVLWLVSIQWMTIFFFNYFWSKNWKSYFFFKLMHLHSLNSNSKFYSKMKGSYSMKIFLFVLMLFSNLFGLIPYMYMCTSQIFFVALLTFFVWTSLVLSSLMFKPLSFSYQFFPVSPSFILPFLKVIEMLSFLLRPLTLSLRLAMNMTTGHVLVGLLSSMFLFLMNSKSLFFLKMILFMLIGIFFFESCICIIQALVYTLLLSSYWDDHVH